MTEFRKPKDAAQTADVFHTALHENWLQQATAMLEEPASAAQLRHLSPRDGTRLVEKAISNRQWDALARLSRLHGQPGDHPGAALIAPAMADGHLSTRVWQGTGRDISATIVFDERASGIIVSQGTGKAYPATTGLLTDPKSWANGLSKDDAKVLLEMVARTVNHKFLTEMSLFYASWVAAYTRRHAVPLEQLTLALGK